MMIIHFFVVLSFGLTTSFLIFKTHKERIRNKLLKPNYTEIAELIKALPPPIKSKKF